MGCPGPLQTCWVCLFVTRHGKVQVRVNLSWHPKPDSAGYAPGRRRAATVTTGGPNCNCANARRARDSCGYYVGTLNLLSRSSAPTQWLCRPALRAELYRPAWLVPARAEGGPTVTVGSSRHELDAGTSRLVDITAGIPNPRK